MIRKASYYKFRWLLFSAGNHSICSPNDLFDWPCYLFMDILDAGQMFIVTLHWRSLCSCSCLEKSADYKAHGLFQKA